MRPELLNTFEELGVPRYAGSPLSTRKYLGLLHAETSNIAKCADALPFPRRAMGLRAILDQRNSGGT